MELHQLPGPLPPDELVTQGQVAALTRGPSTVEQVLQRARLAMEEEDRLEALSRDPVRHLGVRRRRRGLLAWLLGR